MLAWMKNIAMFLVISGLLLEMIAETKYYKFARWVTGVILILQLVEPLVTTQNLWDRLIASLRSFDYAISSERVLEEIYTTSENATQTVLESYKDSMEQQVERILEQHHIKLEETEITVKEDGTPERLLVLGRYQTTEETGGLRIPTIVPVQKVELESEGQKEEEERMVSPLELSLQETLAEFYRIEKNRIEVVIQEVGQ